MGGCLGEQLVRDALPEWVRGEDGLHELQRDPFGVGELYDAAWDFGKAIVLASAGWLIARAAGFVEGHVVLTATAAGVILAITAAGTFALLQLLVKIATKRLPWLARELISMGASWCGCRRCSWS
jgi:hypothetical protein